MNQQLEHLCSKNISYERSAEQIGVSQAYHKRGLGAKTPADWTSFVIFQQKNSPFSVIWMTFRTIVETFENTELLNLKIIN